MRTTQPRENPTRLRILRRALGLTQEAFAALLGKSQSQIARIEDGSQQPTFFEGLIIELILGAPAIEIFPMLRESAKRKLLKRLRTVKAKQEQSSSSHARSAYKAAQLERLTASIESRDPSSFSAHSSCQTKQFLDWVERYL